MDRDEIRKACDAATPGPWVVTTYLGRLSSWGKKPEPVRHDFHESGHINEYVLPVNDSDAVFISGAREWVPALLDENEKLREALRGYVEWAEYMGYGDTPAADDARALLAEGE